VDLGIKRGQSVQQFLRSTPDAHRYSVHAFESNPAHLPALRAFAQRSPAAARITVHLQAAWTTATQVCTGKLARDSPLLCAHRCARSARCTTRAKVPVCCLPSPALPRAGVLCLVCE